MKSNNSNFVMHTTEIKTPMLCISIVSHDQGNLISLLLADLQRLQRISGERHEIIVTINIPENEGFLEPFSDLDLRVIRNKQPKGFGANHNAAFSESRGRFFAVVNPDIRIQELNSRELLSPFKNKKVAVVAPLILSGEGNMEDSARHFPTLWRLAKRVLFRQRKMDYKLTATATGVDWVAGMFMVFRPEAFRQILGFDDRRFFMYLEDADICFRLHKNGWEVVLNPNVQVTHHAQRASRRNLKHMQWHAISAVRYLTGL